MTFQKTDAELIYALDQEYPAVGTIGYLVPLNAALALNKTFTADAPSNVITFPTAQTFRSGSRVRVTATTTLPTPLTAGVDYYLNKITATTFKLYDTLAGAIAGTTGSEMNIIDAGSGVLTANEQAFTVKDPIDVLLSHEFAAGILAVPRPAVTNVGTGTIVSAMAQKNILLTIQNSSTADISIGYFLFNRGGTGAIGSVPAGHQIEILTAPVTLIAGDSKIYNLKMKRQNIA
jgi:hypothetical protein